MYGAAVNSAINNYRKNGCYPGTANFDKKSVQENSPKEKDIWESLRKFDGFEDNPVEGGAAGCYSPPAAKQRKAPAEKNNEEKVKKPSYFIDGEEVSEKKFREIQDAYEYFRKAAANNGYTVVKSGTDSGFSYSLQSGKRSVIMIDPEFMNSIRNDPEALKRYADEIENMKRLDKQFERQAKQQGKTVVSRGWRIEKDGSISSWSVTKTERKASKGQLERMNELRNKILKKKMKKKKEEALIQEKRSKRKEEELRLEGKKRAAAKEGIKRKLKKVRVYDLTRLTPKKYPGSGKCTSVSISCGRSPSLLTSSKDGKK